jgi:hypothetical protein
MKNSSYPLLAHAGESPPPEDTCHLPFSTSGKGRTKISSRPVSSEM